MKNATNSTKLQTATDVAKQFFRCALTRILHRGHSSELVQVLHEAGEHWPNYVDYIEEFLPELIT